MDAIHRPRHFSAELFSYAENKKIFEIFQNILEKISIDRPEEPVTYLYNLLVKKDVYDAPKVLMLGPPSLDRTLVATVLALKLGLMHIAVECLIEESANPELLKAPDLVTLVKERLEKPDCARRGWILEGFPKTRTQAFFLRKSGIFPTHIALVEPHDLLELSMEEMTYEIQDYLAHKPLIVDFHKNSYLRNFTVDNDAHEAVAEVIEFVRSREQPAMPYLPRVLLLGPYGSGRKTAARKVAEKYNLIEVNFQQELRKAAIKNTPLKERICEVLKTSSPIPNDVLVEAASQRLMQKDCIESGWVMYNFPDTVEQAELLAKSLGGFPINRAVFLDASLQNCLDRVEPRRLDPKTGRAYHLKLNPSEEKKVWKRLIQLPQDSAEMVEAEYIFFRENEKQLKEFFQQNFSDDITVEVNADQSEYDTFEAVQGAILKSTRIKLTT